MEEAMSCHVPGQLAKDCCFNLGCSRSHSLPHSLHGSQLPYCGLTYGNVFVTKNCLQPIASKDLRLSTNSHMNRMGAEFPAAPADTLMTASWETVSQKHPAKLHAEA